MGKDSNHKIIKAAAATAVTVTGAYAATCYVIFNHIFELDAKLPNFLKKQR